MTFPKLISAEYLSGYSLRLTFSDGIKAEVNFQNELTGGIFEALKDPKYFQSFSFRDQFGSIEWDNGADFAPEFLYEFAKTSGQPTTGLDSASRRKTA